MSRAGLACAAALALAAGAGAPGKAGAHEVMHEVERGRAVALRAFFPDGEALAYVPAEVYSPADPGIPHWKGRTDRNGWVAFVPDVAGRWRVRIVEAGGHGLDTEVEVASPAGGAAAPGGGAAPQGGAAAPSWPGAAAFLLRPVVGVALVAAIFGALYLLRRRRSR